jgi:hypothetical protein
MWEFERKERHLLSGLGLQILIVGLLVFAYTQAFRQLKYERSRQLQLQEQLTLAREEVARHAAAAPQRAALEAEVADLRARWVGPDGLAQQAKRIQRQAEAVRLQDVRVKLSDDPVETLQISRQGRSELTLQLYSVEISGTGTTRELAALLANLSGAGARPLCLFDGLEVKASETAEPTPAPPVQFTARSLIPVSPSDPPSPEPPPAQGPVAPEVPPPPAPARVPSAWGPRTEPFLSPLISPGAFRLAPKESLPFKLTGILWDPKDPACLINGNALHVGEKVGPAQVVLITPNAVLLESDGEELLLYP